MTQASKGKILVIDDDDTTRQLMVSMLFQAGYDPIEAASGAEGIELALRSPPHLILCDLLMPGIDGFGVLARMRAEPKTAAIPLIFVTASKDPGDPHIGFLLGANDYVTKPIDYAKLMDLIALRLKNRSP